MALQKKPLDYVSGEEGWLLLDVDGLGEASVSWIKDLK